MLWRGEHVCGWANFSDASGVEDKDAIREACEQSGIVGDENHREAELLPKGPEELQDFLLRCGVEGRGRFIGDDERRPAGDRLGDEYSLTLASAQFVRIGAGDAFGVLGKNRREKLADFFVERASIQRFVGGHNVGNLLSDLQGGMERGRRLLKDQADASAANFPEIFGTRREQILSLRKGLNPFGFFRWMEEDAGERRQACSCPSRIRRARRGFLQARGQN